MSWRPHPKRARVNPRSPEAWATDDRSGFVENLVNLGWEYRWAGTQLINTRILTGDAYRDVPNEQERVIKIPPDPDPVLNARPETYQVDEFMNTPLYAESGQVLRNEANNQVLLNDNPLSPLQAPPPPPPSPSAPSVPLLTTETGSPLATEAGLLLGVE